MNIRIYRRFSIFSMLINDHRRLWSSMLIFRVYCFEFRPCVPFQLPLALGFPSCVVFGVPFMCDVWGSVRVCRLVFRSCVLFEVPFMCVVWDSVHVCCLGFRLCVVFGVPFVCVRWCSVRAGCLGSVHVCCLGFVWVVWCSVRMCCLLWFLPSVLFGVPFVCAVYGSLDPRFPTPFSPFFLHVRSRVAIFHCFCCGVSVDLIIFP